MPDQASGNSTSGGLNQGCLNDRYQDITRGWFGDGLVPALRSAGTMNALEATARATPLDVAELVSIT